MKLQIFCGFFVKKYYSQNLEIHKFLHKYIFKYTSFYTTYICFTQYFTQNTLRITQIHYFFTQRLSQLPDTKRDPSLTPLPSSGYVLTAE